MSNDIFDTRYILESKIFSVKDVNRAIYIAGYQMMKDFCRSRLMWKDIIVVRDEWRTIYLSLEINGARFFVARDDV